MTDLISADSCSCGHLCAVHRRGNGECLAPDCDCDRPHVAPPRKRPPIIAGKRAEAVSQGGITHAGYMAASGSQRYRCPVPQD